jgi:type I restriction enzyme R subunit
VEAKELGLPAETGVQQAKEYAEILGLKFAYATNGHNQDAAVAGFLY